MQVRSSALAGLALTVAAASGLHAQSLRTVSSTRERTRETHLDVSVEFAAGRFTLRPLAGGALFTESLTYDEDKFEPRGGYDAASQSLSAGLKTINRGSVNYPGNRPPQVLDLALTRAVPVQLNLKFGAVEADLELGGLAIANATIETGASASEVRFSVPNRVRCERFTMHVGAAKFTAHSLGNARCQRIELKGGVGGLTLDFDGVWIDDADAHISVDVGLGSVTLRLPRDLGVAVHIEKFLADVDMAGMTKRGSVYYSANYESARKKVDIDVNAALGDIKVEWIGH